VAHFLGTNVGTHILDAHPLPDHRHEHIGSGVSAQAVLRMCDGSRIRMGAVAGDVGSIRLRTSPFCYDGCRQKPALIAVVASQGS